MMADGFWSFGVADVLNAAILLATIAAIVLGPIRAVKIAQSLESDRDAYRRKREIFSTLMRTRRTYMVPEHVGALNLIQVEFFNHQRTIDAHRNYMTNLSQPIPDGASAGPFLERRADLFVDLLHEISVVIDLPLDKRDIERLGYMPQGWSSDEGEIRAFRRGLVEIIEGRKALQVQQFVAPVKSPFPPPPSS